jgi:hypothetical protein
MLEVMLSTAITAFVFAGVLSAYIFLGRSLARQVNQMDLESRARTTLNYFTGDVTAAVGFEPTGGLDPLASAPSATQFEIDTMQGIAPTGLVPNPPPVECTALYTYSPPSGTIPGTLSVVRTPPSGVLSSTMQQPNWATNEYGQKPKPLFLLTNISSLSFTYYSAASVLVPANTPPLTMSSPYVVPPSYYYVNATANNRLESVPAPNIFSIKSIVMSFTTTEPFTGGAAQSNLSMSSGPVVMKNKAILQDPNSP